MFTDELRHKVWNEIRQHGLRSFAKLLPDEVFAQAAERADVRLGRSALSLVQMVWLGIASASHCTVSFATVLQLTLKLLEDQSDWRPTSLGKVRSNRREHASGRGKKSRSKHAPHGSCATQVSEEAFVQARRRMPFSFWMALLIVVGERFEQQHAARIRWKQFRLLAMDGTTINLPAWKRLREHFGTAKNGKKSKHQTQARMVMLHLPLVRMPWRYAVGPLKQGERTLAAALLDELRTNDLVLLDRGFWSYGLFHQVQARNAYFAIRLSAGIRLQSVKRLGQHERLVRWNMPTGPRWRGSGLPNSIDLRVVHYKIPGFRPSAIVTNLLDPKTVSREDWVRLATETEPGDERLGVGLYHRRWEIEVSQPEDPSSAHLYHVAA
jgi:Transposase DDE domain